MSQDKTGQLLCTSCGITVPNQVHFCTSCEHILPLPDRVSYFEFMELPLKLDIDLKGLEKTFFRLSRQFHPDFYQNRPDSEQRAALGRAATLNRAYDTLRDTAKRIEYLMKLSAFEQSTPKNQVPPDLMIEILELQEQLENLQGADESERGPAARQLEAGLEEMKERLNGTGGQLDTLCREYDQADDASKRAVLQKMRETIDKSNYLRRIVLNIESALGISS
jgi:molecular chaperone HscB